MAVDEALRLAELDADWQQAVYERSKRCTCRVCLLPEPVRAWIDAKIREIEAGIRNGRHAVGLDFLVGVLARRGLEMSRNNINRHKQGCLRDGCEHYDG